MLKSVASLLTTMALLLPQLTTVSIAQELTDSTLRELAQDLIIAEDDPARYNFQFRGLETTLWFPVADSFFRTPEDIEFKRMVYKDISLPYIPEGTLKYTSIYGEVYILELESCLYAYGEVLGIPAYRTDDESTESDFDPRYLIQLERINLALSRLGAGLSVRPGFVASALRPDSDLRALNEALLQQYAEEVIDRPAIVLNPSYECGDGGDIWAVKAAASIVEFAVVPEFWYTYCEAKGANPLDSSQCRFTSNSTTRLFSGIYRYRARLVDGRVLEGRLNFTSEADTERDENGNRIAFIR